MGEIYNILGKIVPVTRGPDPEMGLSYLVNGRTILTSEDMRNILNYGLLDGFPNTQYPRIDLAKPIFGIKILDVIERGTDKNGLPTWFERADFNGNALAGYSISNVSYTATSTKLPAQKDIELLVPRLIRDFEKELGLKVNPDEIGMHLLWEF